MRFLLYLVKSEHLTAEQAIQALSIQLDSTKPLGRLALEERMLTVRQVMKVLEEQADNPDLRFGELAVGLRFLSDEQVAKLLMRQHRQRRSLDQVLIGMDIVRAPELAIVRQRYRLTML